MRRARAATGTRRSVSRSGAHARCRRSRCSHERHRVAVDGVHVDVDGEQVVAALGAVREHVVEEVPRVQPLALQPALHVGEGDDHGVDLAVVDPLAASVLEVEVAVRCGASCALLCFRRVRQPSRPRSSAAVSSQCSSMTRTGPVVAVPAQDRADDALVLAVGVGDVGRRAPGSRAASRAGRLDRGHRLDDAAATR